MQLHNRLIGLFLLSSLVFSSIGLQAQTDLSTMHGGEGGLWLPVNLKQLNAMEMADMGLEIPIDSVYHPEGRDLSDAVVRLNGGSCTAEAVSKTGLIFTNHHCAFDMVAELSTEENDLLTDGFWAYELGQEIPLPGATASFLVESRDVTEEVLSSGPAQADAMAAKVESAIMGKLMAEGASEGQYEVVIKPVFNGSEYYLFLYETFRDLRLAGIPPTDIGKYGYDQDNWVWPRHTGDFAILRVYAGADNRPSDYSDANRPYEPKHYFPINISGVEEGDYNMIMGYPGSTERYLTSYAIEQEIEQNNPDRIELMGDVAEIMDAAMEASNSDRIALEGAFAGLMNGYKYYIGQNTMLQRYDIAEKKAAAEEAFLGWTSDPDFQSHYGSILSDMESAYGEIAPFEKFYNHLVYSTVHPDVASKGVFFSYQSLSTLRRALGSGQEAAINEVSTAIRSELDDYEESLVLSIDSDLFVAHFLNLYENLPEDMHPEIFAEVASGYLSQPEEEEMVEELVEEVVEEKKKKRPFWKRKKKEVPVEEPVLVIEEDPMAYLTLEERVQAWTDAAYEVALAVNLDKLEAFLDNPDLEELNQDPLVRFSLDMISTYVYKVARSRNVLSSKLDGLYKDYLIALRQMYPDKVFYPDANSTMRVSYGTVESYRPRDGVVYKHYTTLGGAIEKEDEAPEDPDYKVPSKLRELYEAKDFGPYGEDELVTCFLNTCESSGGSSGSPVLNGRGELVGIAFDGNWEAMTSDIYPIPSLTRSIVVDARYVLFVIDKFAGAHNLIEELEIIKE